MLWAASYAAFTIASFSNSYAYCVQKDGGFNVAHT
jgi:hypothetical protein